MLKNSFPSSVTRSGLELALAGLIDVDKTHTLFWIPVGSMAKYNEQLHWHLSCASHCWSAVTGHLRFMFLFFRILKQSTLSRLLFFLGLLAPKSEACVQMPWCTRHCLLLPGLSFTPLTHRACFQPLLSWAWSPPLCGKTRVLPQLTMQRTDEGTSDQEGNKCRLLGVWVGLQPYRIEGVKKLNEKGDTHYRGLWESPCTGNSPECISYKKGSLGCKGHGRVHRVAPNPFYFSMGAGGQTDPGSLLEWPSRVSLPVFLCTASDIGCCKHSLKVIR